MSVGVRVLCVRIRSCMCTFTLGYVHVTELVNVRAREPLNVYVLFCTVCECIFQMSALITFCLWFCFVSVCLPSRAYILSLFRTIYPIHLSSSALFLRFA